MKLRYIKNLYWYDGPLADLYIDDDGLDLYIVTPLVWTKTEYAVIARRVDETVYFDDKDGVNWPEDFLEFKYAGEFYIGDMDSMTIEKDFGTTLKCRIIDVRLMTAEERKSLEFKFD
jgi:hypothetical protein